jgi:hypothetical protein
MKLVEVLENMYGVRTDMRVNPITDTIATSATQLLRNNPNRLAWTLINLGSEAVYLSFTPDVGTTKGIYVASGGGTMGLLFSEDFELVTYPVYGIGAAGGDKIYLVEVIAL